jgi:hypothetical protein
VKNNDCFAPFDIILLGGNDMKIYAALEPARDDRKELALYLYFVEAGHQLPIFSLDTLEYDTRGNKCVKVPLELMPSLKLSMGLTEVTMIINQVIEEEVKPCRNRFFAVLLSHLPKAPFVRHCYRCLK